ncbi:MAG: AAA family ATPase [Myxococcota bacterium]|nr:AAA family ATPase [Myxococcota bacterium]
MGDAYFDELSQLVLFRLNQDTAAATAQAQLLATLRTPTFFQLARVAAAFNLDEAATLLLALLTAADRDPRIWVIARSHHRDPARVGIDCAVASIALDVPVPLLIDAAERLRRLDLITTSQHGLGYRPFVALFAVPRIVDVLVGGGSDDEDLIGIVAPPTPAVDTETLVVPETAIASLRTMLSRRGPAPPVVIIQGIEGVGKRSVVAAVAAELGLATLVTDALELPHDLAGLRRVLAALAREARLSDGIVFIDNADGVSEPLRNQALATMLGVLVRSPVLASTGGQVECAPRGRPVVRVDVPSPAAPDRQRLWAFHLGDRATEEVTVALADRYPITPGLIARASETALILSKGAIAPDHVKEAIGSELAERFRGIGKRVDKHESWEDLVLSAENRDAITELISRVGNSRRVVGNWGFGDKLTKGLGMSALFSGEPGTGKTMVAALIAGELGLQLYQIDLANLVSKYIGETEKNLARAFDAAEAGHAVLLFDEADALFGKRTSDVKSSTDRYANMETNYLLQRIERFSGVAILTTNLITSIDPAFQRRIAVHVRFDMPDEDVRTQLWARLLPATAPRSSDIDFRSLGRTYKFSGGFIRNAVLRAAYLAAAEGTKITMSQLSRAADLEAWEMGRVI